MDSGKMVNPTQRRKYAALVREHPGATAEELQGRMSAYERAVFGTMLLALRERRDVRVDESGRIWPTG